MIPMTEVAIPTCEGERPMPPLKWNQPFWLSSGARGVGRNTNVMELKALVCMERRKWVRSVRTTFLENICFHGECFRTGVTGA